MIKPELLAPAGNREAFEAALAAGADAIYLGAGDFNARRNADNFGFEDLSRACHDAHLRGRRVYLTANTLVMEGEMPRALDTVSRAAEAGVDAAIIQDVGLASVLRRELPELELHTSTQMNIRDERGIEIARKLGFSRVTLARELSIEKIARLAQAGMDLEVFVHGALCICQSGQCLLSSMVGGRSANRGLCAQPCRLPYKLVDGEGKRIDTDGQYLLSPRDLMGLEVLDRLVDAGVASLKIEGRMKSPEYVSTVVDVYRRALDGIEGADEPTEEDRGLLAEAFNRGFTTAYLTGNRGNEIMGYKRPNNRGVAVGRVNGFKNNRVEIATTVPLAVGDLLEVWTKKGRVTHTVTKDDDRRVGTARCSIRGAVWPGDRVFRVRSALLAAAADERTRAGLEIPVAIGVTMRMGEPVRIEVADARGHVGTAEGAAVEAARTKAISRDDVIDHVGRLGGTPYVCSRWDIDLDEGVGIGFSALHKLRAAAIDDLERELLASAGEHRVQPEPPLDFRHVQDLSQMAPHATTIDFADTDIALEIGQLERGHAIGPKLYATNLEALQTWAALGATFAWLSPELTLHQMKLLADNSPIPLGTIVSGRTEFMVSDHCFLMAAGPCDQKCAKCKRRAEHDLFLEDRKGYRFWLRTDERGRGHLYNAVSLDVVHAVGDMINAGVRGFAVDATLMSAGEAEHQMNRLRSAINGHKVEKLPDTTTGHVFRPVE